jgi:hypothetical protein
VQLENDRAIGPRPQKRPPGPPSVVLPQKYLIDFCARGTLRSPKLAAWETNPLWAPVPPARRSENLDQAAGVRC